MLPKEECQNVPFQHHSRLAWLPTTGKQKYLLYDRHVKWVLPTLPWVEAELAAVEEDSDAVVVEGSEAAGIGFEGLDFGVEAFHDGVGDAVLEVGQEVGQVALQGFCRLDDGT